MSDPPTLYSSCGFLGLFPTQYELKHTCDKGTKYDATTGKCMFKLGYDPEPPTRGPIYSKCSFLGIFDKKYDALEDVCGPDTHLKDWKCYPKDFEFVYQTNGVTETVLKNCSDGLSALEQKMVGVQQVNKSDRPKGCYYEQGKGGRYNVNMSSTTECSDEYKCAVLSVSPDLFTVNRNECFGPTATPTIGGYRRWHTVSTFGNTVVLSFPNIFRLDVSGPFPNERLSVERFRIIYRGKECMVEVLTTTMGWHVKRVVRVNTFTMTFLCEGF